MSYHFLNIIGLTIVDIITSELIYILGAKMKNINEMDDEEKMEQLMNQYQRKMKSSQNQPKQAEKSRKKVTEDVPPIKKSEEMQAEVRKVNKMKFQDLPQEIQMYLIEIYPYGNKLFLTGIMDNGQTLNILANDLYRQIYFVLKEESGNQGSMSERYIQRAEEQIKQRLRSVGLADDQYFGEMVDMQYVFEIRDIPRNMRKYYKVRYSFKTNLTEEIEPDWEGDTYKYVIGTSYTALELLIVNKRVKGPCWIKISKDLLSENHHNTVEVGLCADMKFPEQIQVTNRIQPPTVRVLSFSLKSIVPATIAKKKYFLKDKDQSHIYAISYHFCGDYKVSIKDQKPKLIHRTYYLEELGKPMSNQFIGCVDQNTLLSRFQADICKFDPDFIVCHDSSTLLDFLICKLAKLDKNAKIKFSRLRLAREPSKINQTQRINSFLAGRLLVDTFLHSKEMVKSIEYNLENIAQYARPQKKFTGFTQEEERSYFNEDKPSIVISKCRDQSELTFQIMNHFEILQMTRQLSNICGNLWKRSLQNKRAERNQFLIMHECKQRNLIIPDKFRKEKGDQEEVEAKKKYQGGMVFQPEKGFYSDYILLLDFNSLYPSIIRQYNVCFSIIDRPKLTLDFYYKSKNKKKELKEKKQKMEMDQQNPEDDGLEEMFANVKSCDSKKEWGFLPTLIDSIVEQRKKCKKKMKKTSNPAQFFILQIQQKCYKVVANSIYGCLGFSISRFYSRPLAALITKKGRDSLMSARDIVSKRGSVRVIYGDTDSLMIQPSDLKTQDSTTEVQKLKNLKKVADQLKIEINKQYTFLEIDIDGIFKPLILLMKKKYVANKLTNFEEILVGGATQPKFSLEYKGIQLVRRDGCKLARDIQQQVINIMIKSDECQLDSRYQQIIDLFTKLHSEISDQSKYPLQNFLFSKQLSKKPKEYNNADNLPHVKVAKDRIEAGEKEESLVNHTIFYLICKPRNETDVSLAKNAFDMKSYKNSQKYDTQNKLELDYDHYKSIVVQPVGRLLANINTQIYDHIVKILDISKHRIKNVRDLIGEDVQEPEKLGEMVGNNIKNKVKQFGKELGGANIKCLNQKCQHQFSLISLESQNLINSSCPKCGQCITNVIYNKIRYKIKQEESAYYNNRKRCRCSKAYELTPMIHCCDIDKKSSFQKFQTSFKLHNFLYLVLDLCEIAQSRLKTKGMDADTEIDGLTKITQMASRFMEESNYEKVCDGISQLKL